jgi:hypothetical protein
MSALEAVTAEVYEGDTLSTMTASLLRRLGIDPVTTAKFRRSHGTAVERETGYATFALAERDGYAPVAFGSERESRIGMTTPCDLGLEVDKASGRLVRVPYLLPSLWPVDTDKPEQEEHDGTDK